MANPFKDVRELTRDVETFLRKNRSSIFNNAKRLSDFFEMACYNNIVRFYENNGFKVEIKNLIKNRFRYKCTTAGDPANYSFFEVSKSCFSYEIRHNINIKSYHNSNTYTTPDICVLKSDSIKLDNEFYDTKRKYFYAENNALISFFEVKNFNPFPELLFNFIGVVNELKPVLLRQPKNYGKNHIATSLMMSGKANKHANRIIDNLHSRYHLNLISDLFNIGGIKFGKRNIKKFKSV